MRIPAAPALAFFLITSQHATAADFIHAADPNRPDIITITGFIQAGDAEKFLGIAWGLNKQATIILDSQGGHIRDAIIIGQFVRAHKWETVVQSRAVCNSACTLIWLAGTVRSLGSQARLGFHSASYGRGKPLVRDEGGNAKMAEFMAAMGVPQQVIDLQPKADPCCLNYIDHKQAVAWKARWGNTPVQVPISVIIPLLSFPPAPGWPAQGVPCENNQSQDHDHGVGGVVKNASSTRASCMGRQEHGNAS